MFQYARASRPPFLRSDTELAGFWEPLEKCKEEGVWDVFY